MLSIRMNIFYVPKLWELLDIIKNAVVCFLFQSCTYQATIDSEFYLIYFPFFFS